MEQRLNGRIEKRIEKQYLTMMTPVTVMGPVSPLAPPVSSVTVQETRLIASHVHYLCCINLNSV